MLKTKENVKQKIFDNKITREELKRFEKWETASDEVLDSIIELMYNYSLLLLNCKKNE